MNILILDSWLRKYLKTSAKPQELAEKLSLTSVSVEKIIGAITPQEIAISIVAELIAVKHGKVSDPNAPAVSMRWDGALARR